MSAEYMAEKLLDENVRSRGYFFTLTHKGRHYEVEVVEVTSR